MTRASFLITLWLSAAAAAQQPSALPLPGAEPGLPLPDAEKKPEAKKKKEAAKPADAKAAASKPVPAPPLPLPGFDDAKPADNKVAAPPLPLPGTQPAPPPAAIAQPKPPAPAGPTPAVTAQPKPPAPAPRAPAAGAAAPPMAAAAVRPPDLRLRPDPDQQLWSVRAFVGGERSTEQSYTSGTSQSRLGAEVTRWFSGTWLARAEFDWRSSAQAYVPLHSATNSPVSVDENRFDGALNVGFDLGPKIAESGRLELTPMLGLAYVGIRNQACPSDLIGPNIGGRARWTLSPAVIAHATLGYTYNLSVASAQSQNSALKSPHGDFNARAGLALPLAGGYALELDYSSDVIAFENTFRVANGAALGFGTSF